MHPVKSWMFGAALLAAGPVARAQVELIYRQDGVAHVITTTENGRVAYRQDQAKVVAGGDGQWEIRPIATFAEIPGEVSVHYNF